MDRGSDRIYSQRSRFLESDVGSRGAVTNFAMTSMRHLKFSSTVVALSGDCGRIAERRGYPLWRPCVTQNPVFCVSGAIFDPLRAALGVVFGGPGGPQVDLGTPPGPPSGIFRKKRFRRTCRDALNVAKV